MSLETSQTEELELNTISEPEQVEAEEISSKDRFAFFTNIKKAYVKYITRLGAAVCYMVKHAGCAIAGGFVGAAVVRTVESQPQVSHVQSDAWLSPACPGPGLKALQETPVPLTRSGRSHLGIC